MSLNVLPTKYRRVEGLRERVAASEVRVYKANADGSRGEYIGSYEPTDIIDYTRNYRCGKRKVANHE